MKKKTAMLARNIGAQEFYTLTEVDYVYLNFGTSQQKKVEKIRLEELTFHYRQGQFPQGTIGPKIKAAIDFLESGTERVVITSL
jgi:carbamate kinase